MEVNAITTDLIESALHNWQHAQDPPAALLQLDLLTDTGAVSAIEQAFYLHDLIVSLVAENLNRHRQNEGALYNSEQSASSQDISTALSADYRFGNSELESWSAVYHRYLAPFSVSVEKLASVAGVATRQFRRRLDTGLARLVDLLRRTEMSAHNRLKRVHLRRHLPLPDYARLFGTKALIQQIIALLSDPAGPRFVSIEGLGGLGKTALAQVLAHRFAENGDLVDILWVSARQEWITDQGELKQLDDPARSLDDVVARLIQQLGQEQLIGLSTSDKLARLQLIFSTVSYLVIIDNLETMVDSQMLIPALYPFAGATRFLLTSRYTLRSHPYIHVIPVPELSLKDSRALIESELVRRGRNNFLSTDAMQDIYRIIGGLPLALKLTAAQMGRLPLDVILEGLRQASHHTPEKMYSYIYRRIWYLLDNYARQLLLSMLLVSADGENISWLRSMSELDNTHFELALTQLLDFSLLEITGSLKELTYRLHRLTFTFLQTEILQNWEDEEGKGIGSD